MAAAHSLDPARWQEAFEGLMGRTAASFAHAFLAVVRADAPACHPAPAELTPLTCNEIQPLFTTLIVGPVHDVAHRLGRSDWRRPTRPEPRPATTADTPRIGHEDHDLRLEQ